DLEPRELRPDRGDQQEGDHAGEQVDVRNEIQLGVERLLAAAAPALDRNSHGTSDISKDTAPAPGFPRSTSRAKGSSRRWRTRPSTSDSRPSRRSARGR